MKRTIIVISIISLLFQTSCNKTDEKYIIVSGTVLNEQSNIPLNDINVSLSHTIGSASGTSGWFIIATEITGTDGKFSFDLEVDDANGWKIDINSNPYDSKYSTRWFTVDPNTMVDSIIYIYRNTTLTVTASTDDPLGPDDSFSMNLPGIGCTCEELTSYRAKGDALNKITWTVIRDNSSSKFQESIFCPVDSTTYYNIYY